MTRAFCSVLALLVVGLPCRASAQPTAPTAPTPGVPAAAPPLPPAPPAPAGSPQPAPPPTAVPPPEGGDPRDVPPEAPPGPYYVEPAPGAGPERERRRPHRGPEVFEPPVPGAAPAVIFEPPPPPVPRHIAPMTSLWLGARLGWFVPFGNLYARTVSQGAYVEQRGVPWRNYATSGPMFELDLGARLSRNYNLFALWERAALGEGRGDDGLLGSTAHTTGGDTDFWGVGVRASSDADRVGFLSEIALGYRRARSEWDDGTTLELTQGLFEARLGFGADIRINRKFALSPMITFGVGLFGEVDLVDANGRAVDVLQTDDEEDGHAWFTLQMGAHFDLSGGR